MPNPALFGELHSFQLVYWQTHPHKEHAEKIEAHISIQWAPIYQLDFLPVCKAFQIFLIIYVILGPHMTL